MRTKKNRLFAACALMAALYLFGCGNASNVGLLEAPSSESVQTTTDYPAVVKVGLPNGLGMCSGTFISPRTILSASHCAPSDGQYWFFTSFGTYNTYTRVTYGPGTVDDFNDIAIFILSADRADPTKGQVIPLGTEVSLSDKVRLVGYGCNDLNTKSGSGVKRTGTNQIASIDDYLQLLTPVVNNAILGPINRAGSCFGDSGGPLLAAQPDMLKVVGISHAGSWNSDVIRSEYIDLNRSDNSNFLHQVDTTYQLSLYDGCWTKDDPNACAPSQSASLQLMAFFKWIWSEVLSFF